MRTLGPIRDVARWERGELSPEALGEHGESGVAMAHVHGLLESAGSIDAPSPNWEAFRRTLSPRPPSYLERARNRLRQPLAAAIAASILVSSGAAAAIPEVRATITDAWSSVVEAIVQDPSPGSTSGREESQETNPKGDSAGNGANALPSETRDGKGSGQRPDEDGSPRGDNDGPKGADNPKGVLDAPPGDRDDGPDQGPGNPKDEKNDSDPPRDGSDHDPQPGPPEDDESDDPDDDDDDGDDSDNDGEDNSGSDEDDDDPKESDEGENQDGPADDNDSEASRLEGSLKSDHEQQED